MKPTILVIHRFCLFPPLCKVNWKQYCTAVSKNNKHPPGYWEKEENVMHFIDSLKENLNLRTIDDWNCILQKQIKFYGGSRLLQKYSMFEIKCLGCPEGKLQFKKRKLKKETGYWKNKENVLSFLNDLSKKLNLITFDDWNLITGEQIKLYGGKTLLNHYSIYDLKCMGFPNGKSKFAKVKQYKPPGYWEDSENINKFLDHLREKLNLQNFDDWNSITQKQIHLFGGGSLFRKYSLLDIKCMGFPKEKLRFQNNSNIIGYWKKKENIEKFILKLADGLKLENFDDWNSITQNQIHSFGGGSLLSEYSLYDIKCMGYPDGKSQFNKSVPYKTSTFWDNEDNVKQFLLKIKRKFNLVTIEDWKRLSKTQIISEGGKSLLSRYPKTELFQYIPNLSDNDISNSTNENNSRSSQRWLFLQVQKLFPNDEIVEDYFHSEISRKTGFPIQFDIFIINKNIAFEYHGRQHYEDIPASGFASLEMYKFRDSEKEIISKQFGIILIVIPYWWDNQLTSLKQTINSISPEILNNNNKE